MVQSTIAQTYLQGVVIEKDSGVTIPFASIALYQNGTLIQGTDTDFDGNYLFSNIDAGVYDAEAKFLGYATSRIESVVVRASKTNALNFQLEEEGDSNYDVRITKYKMPLISLDETTSMETLSSQDIRKHGITNISSLAALTAGLSSVSGSDSTVLGASGDSTFISTEGVKVNASQTDLIKESRRKTGKVFKNEEKLIQVKKGKVKESQVEKIDDEEQIKRTERIAKDVISTSASAKTRLKGVVLDGGTQSPIPFATIALFKNGTLITGTDTDFDGNYSFSNIDVGVYDVEAIYLGFATTRVEEVVVSADQVNTLDFQLVEDRGLICRTSCGGNYIIPLISFSDTSTGQTLRPNMNTSRSTQPITLFKGREKRKKLKQKK